MKKYIAVVIALVFYGIFIADTVGVFGQETQQSSMLASMYSDVKAKKIGDTLSVVISESNTATKNAQTNTTKQNEGAVSGDATTGALDGLFPGMGGKVSYDNSYAGQASTSRNGSLNSRMTVLVVDILPNGNLIIEGTKTLEVNNDLEVVTLSGIVQPEHITSTNTVYSYQIANAKLLYKGKGSMTQGQRVGFLGRLINWIF
ncbi:flagellar basal body L-ring protein FlgH [Candidatus Latescibacterota bacterium]